MGLYTISEIRSFADYVSRSVMSSRMISVTSSTFRRALVGISTVTVWTAALILWADANSNYSMTMSFCIVGISVAIACITFQSVEARLLGALSFGVWALTVVSVMSVAMFDVGV